ncbi:MAG: GAF domain-containing protein, partial [Bacteroidota bacterium]
MLLKKLARAGIKEDTPKYLATKIFLSNTMALILAFGIAGPFVVISLIHFPPLSYIPAISIVIGLLMIGVNKLGFNNISRLVISLLPFILTTLYGAYLTPAGEPPIASTMALQLGFAVIPFILFDIREKWLLFFCGLFVLVIFSFLIPTINAFFEIDLDIEIIKTGYVFYITALTAIIVACGSALFMAYINADSVNRTEKLVEEMDVRNEELKESENRMKENMKEIEANQTEEKKRNWASEGLAKFGNLLRSNKESDDLLSDLISGITQYLDANQGGLFLVDNQNDEILINLKSCYAYDRKKFINKSIAPGQGLIGQAYYEKDIIYLKDVPDNYLNITSGLGESLPKSVLIVPLIVNESVEGLFELASFKDFAPH